MIFQNITYLFRKSILFRIGVFCFIVLFASGILFLVSLQNRQRPYIETIVPSVGLPGEVLVVKGTHFGDEQDDSYVEIEDIRLTSSSYIEWSDTEIMAVLPRNVKNGLVYVVTRNGKSGPQIFANKSTIPVPVNYDPQTSVPVIQNILEKKVSIGSSVVITGKNFGGTRNGSKVFFSWQGDAGGMSSAINRVPGSSDDTDRFIACSDSNFDYEFWSDTEIRIRVPDGAVSGNMYVKTEKGQSNLIYTEITGRPGTKSYTDKKTYVVSLSVDIADTAVSGENTLFIRIPRPPVTANQRSVYVTASQPSPILSEYMNIMLHQFENLTNGKKLSVSHSFVIDSYGIQTRIQGKQVKPYSDKTSLLYTAYTKADALVRSGAPIVEELLPSVIGKEKNPYLQAQSIYNWLLKNITLLQIPREGGADVLDALRTKEGDAYDMAVLFCSLARQTGIPAVPVSGILVDKNQKSRIHWWAEFYIEQFGWVPVDPALGSGLEYIPFQEKEDPAVFYFGNIDSQHIIFCRGWNVQKPMAPKSKAVYRPRSYAFQSIWEESSETVKQYSSLWGEPRVDGVY